MRKHLLFILSLVLAFISTNANAFETVSKKSSWAEITSLEALQSTTTAFSLKDADGKFLYTPDNGWDIKVCDETTLLSSQTQGGFFKLEALDSHWLIPVCNMTGEYRENVPSWFKGIQYINAQPNTGDVIFGLAGTNDQHGQDGANLAVWDITYTEGSGFAFHCVGRDIYLSCDASAARPSETIHYWKAVQLTQAYDEAEVQNLYNSIKDAAMTEGIKANMEAAKAAYEGNKTTENLDAYANAVNVASKSAEMYSIAVPGADMTSAIENVDAENGTGEPWVGLARVINNANNAHGGSWLFETAGWGPLHSEMTQTVEGLPVGKYELSAYCMAGTATYAKLHGNNAVSEEVLGTGDAGDDRWKKLSVACKVGADGKLVILAEGNTDNTQNWCNFDDFSLTYVSDGNTITAGKYDITADVTLAEGVSEAMVPEAFKKYLGTYNTKATLEGDKQSLVITENQEEGLFNGFEVAYDEVELAADKTIVLGGKTFTVRAAGSEAENGCLAITADGEGYKMEAADIYFNGKKVVTVSNIVIAVAVEEATYNFYANQAATTVDGFSAIVYDDGAKILLNGNDTKKFSNGLKITIDGTEYTTTKVSNGAQNTFYAPEGKKVYAMTIYSYVNKDAAARTAYWKEVAGVSYSVEDGTAKELVSFKDFANPDVCTFVFPEGLSEVTFTNAGEQVCFVLEISYDATGVSSATADEKADAKVVKVVKDGKIVIVKGDAVYSVTGAQIK